MNRLLLNGLLTLVIGLGGLSLATPAAAHVDGCDGGWDLKCNGNVCCTVCQSTGGIGDCKIAHQ